MLLSNFLNKLIENDGFILETSDKKNFTIGNPKKPNPPKIKLKNKIIEYQLLLFPDFYFGKGYTDGTVVVENGTISEVLDIALKILVEKILAIFLKL